MTLIDFIWNTVSNLAGEIIFALVAAFFAILAMRYRNLWHDFGKGKLTPSPDGKSVAHEVEDEIYVAGKRGLVNLTHSPALDKGPVWSPDSRWFAFQSDRGGGDWNVWVADVETGQLAQITKVVGDERVMGWDMGGNLLLDLGGSLLVVKRKEIAKKLAR